MNREPYLGEVDEIRFEDVPNAVFLTEEQKEQGRVMPEDQQYKVLRLKPIGDGHNSSLLTVAVKAHQMGATYEQTLELLNEQYDPTRADYGSAPSRAVNRVWKSGGDLSKLVDQDSERRPEADASLLAKQPRVTRDEIKGMSPQEKPGKVKTLEVIGKMFDPNDIINIQFSALETGTLIKSGDLSDFLTTSSRKIGEYKFLNPSIFKDVKGCINPNSPDKKISKRCNANVKKRHWMVLEFDPDSAKSKEEQQEDSERFNGFAMMMANHAPLLMALDTGGKSTHYWFNAKGLNPKVHRAFFNIACAHGADPRLSVKSQIARMPNVPAEKEGRRAQKMIYFNPQMELSPSDWDVKAFEEAVDIKQSREIYYNANKKDFICRDNLDSWVSLDRTMTRGMLLSEGLRGSLLEGEAQAPADIAITDLAKLKNINAVLGQASGRNAGYYEENGTRFVVKKSPSFIKPVKGSWGTISDFIDSLLGSEPEQRDVFLGWLSASLKDLRNDGKRSARYSPAQMMHIVGEPNSGKSLLLQNILTPAFGGRRASADPLFEQKPSQFNAEMFGAELLYLDDSPVLKTDYASRSNFGERIKTHTVGVGGNYRAMYQDNVDLKPWWRFIRLMNTESMTLATLPPMDEGVEDKIILLKGTSLKKGSFKEFMESPGWFDRLATMISEEMPGFIHFLLNDYQLPGKLRDLENRYPVCSFKSSWVMREVSQSSAETFVSNLVENMSSTIFPLTKDGRQAYEGTIDELYDILSDHGTRQQQRRFSRLVPSPQVIHSILRNLERTNDRYEYDSIYGEGIWTISPDGKKKKKAPEEEIGSEFDEEGLM